MPCVTSTMLLPTVHPLAAQSWQFDLWSALIGAVVTLLLVGLAYRLREELRLGWESVTAPVAQLSDSLQASFEDRYRDLITEWARARSLLAHVAPLDAVFVEPQLLCPPPLPQSIDQVATSEPSSLPLSRIFGEHNRLAILGPPGVGRTAVLAHLALMCAPAVDERASSETDAKPTALQGRMPLYLSLSTMAWDEDEDENEPQDEQAEEEESEQEESEQEGESIEKLLSTAAVAVGGSDRLVGPLRQHLEAGQAIVLVDGWDELAEHQQEQAAAWLSEVLEAVPENLWLTTAGTRGYAPLIEAGFVPVTLAPWSREQVEMFAGEWIEAATPTGAEPSVTPQVLAMELQRASGKEPLSLALTLRAFLYLSTGDIPTKRSALFDRTLDLLLEQRDVEEAPWLPAACRKVLGQVALDLQRGGCGTTDREALTTTIEDALPPPGERPNRAPSQVLDTLTGERGLLQPMDSNRYAFIHPLWRAYLAARSLVTAGPASLIEHLDDPRWVETLRFYAELGDMRPLVEALLQSGDDIFHSRLRVLSSWANAAPEDAPWLKQTMGLVARSILQPEQPTPVRRELAEAMAKSGVPGVNYFFKQALQHQNADIRLAAITGLGRSATVSELPVLFTALEDEAPAVREEAVRALAYLGGDAARRRLEQLLREGDDTLRALTAEALARHGGKENLPLLRDMAESDDLATRRAAVFGLAQLGERELLEKLVRGDEQWIVRSAAEVALDYLEEQKRISGVAALPEIDQLPWLISWAAAQGEGMGTGAAARRALHRSLQEGERPIRLVAVQTLAQVGGPDDVEPLQAALDDPDPAVADAAVQALGEISKRYDVRIEL